MIGREFQAVFLSTSELVHEDGSSRNPVRSLCDPYVFNTAITRAKSLVVSVGNPFLLLKMENKMAQFYGQEHNAHCWSTYLNLCLHRGTVEFAQHLKLTNEQQANTFGKLREAIESVNDEIRKLSEQQESEDLQRKVEQLELELQKEKELRIQKTSSGQSQPDMARFTEMNLPPDVSSLPPTPFFPFPIDPNTGSTFPPGVPYMYTPQVVPQDRGIQPPLTILPEMIHSPPVSQGFNKTSNAGPPVYNSPHGVVEDIEDPESPIHHKYHAETMVSNNSQGECVNAHVLCYGY